MKNLTLLIVCLFVGWSVSAESSLIPPNQYNYATNLNDNHSFLLRAVLNLLCILMGNSIFITTLNLEEVIRFEFQFQT